MTVSGGIHKAAVRLDRRTITQEVIPFYMIFTEAPLCSARVELLLLSLYTPRDFWSAREVKELPNIDAASRVLCP